MILSPLTMPSQPPLLPSRPPPPQPQPRPTIRLRECPSSRRPDAGAGASTDTGDGGVSPYASSSPSSPSRRNRALPPSLSLPSPQQQHQQQQQQQLRAAASSSSSTSLLTRSPSSALRAAKGGLRDLSVRDLKKFAHLEQEFAGADFQVDAHAPPLCSAIAQTHVQVHHSLILCSYEWRGRGSFRVFFFSRVCA